MIRLKDFSIGFGKKILLENVNTDFPCQKLTALIGSNGTGKSTLLKAICGINEKYRGEIFIDGQGLTDIPKSKLSTLISYVNTQRPRIAHLRCKEVVALGRTPYSNWHGMLNQKDYSLIEESLKMVGMSEYKERYLNSLSDGESQKIMIARSIAQDTDIIILDEPTSFLDLPTRHDLVSLLKRLTRDNGKTILFSTHELDIALKHADEISLIDTPELINLPTSQMIDYIKTKNHPFGCFF